MNLVEECPHPTCGHPVCPEQARLAVEVERLTALLDALVSEAAA